MNERNPQPFRKWGVAHLQCSCSRDIAAIPLVAVISAAGRQRRVLRLARLRYRR
ncbi:hypothetical protein KCP69_24780 [Salmonella enterica subsp. enterica]|nr:hypothetical protein KCP69_24780 [Salmonella enterica subsp. enterica]